MKVFVSYSHKDIASRNKFRTHFSPVESEYGLSVFDDKAIEAGQEWETEIWNQFDQSDLIILLVTANFLASRFCMREEFEKAIARHQNRESIVIPIIVKSCAWNANHHLAKLKGLPDDNKPIHGNDFKSLDFGYSNAVIGIRKLLSALKTDKSKPSSADKLSHAKSFISTPFKAVFFDVDNTLIWGNEPNFKYSWQLVWKHLGYDDYVRKKYFQQYKDKKISYKEWCDINCLHFQERGLKRSDFQRMAKEVHLTNRCRETLGKLKEHGLVTAVVSGGINSFLEAVFPDYKKFFDYSFINEFSYNADDTLQSIKATKYDFIGKYDAIGYVCKKHNILPNECVFIGEGDNDKDASLELIRRGGLVIGYPAHNLVDYIDHNLWKDQLDTILDIIFTNQKIQHTSIQTG